MPQAHRLNLFTKRPIGHWRCPKCGLPMFLACIEPAIEIDHERRTFECSTCAYGETITVNFRIDRGAPRSVEGPGDTQPARQKHVPGKSEAAPVGATREQPARIVRPGPSRAG